jgi:hypothetical protein
MALSSLVKLMFFVDVADYKPPIIHCCTWVCRNRSMQLPGCCIVSPPRYTEVGPQLLHTRTLTGMSATRGLREP